MAVDAVVRGVEAAAFEVTSIGAIAGEIVALDGLPGREPIEVLFRHLAPEPFGILEGTRVHPIVVLTALQACLVGEFGRRRDGLLVAQKLANECGAGVLGHGNPPLRDGLDADMRWDGMPRRPADGGTSADARQKEGMRRIGRHACGTGRPRLNDRRYATLSRRIAGTSVIVRVGAAGSSACGRKRSGLHERRLPARSGRQCANWANASSMTTSSMMPCAL